jgi:CubicO group peptidase (beta-lactamase class C family)
MKTYLCILSLLAALPRWTLAVAEEVGCGPFQYYNACFDVDGKASAPLRAAFDNLDDWLQALATQLQAPSISFGVVYDQELVHYSSVGVTNLQSKEKPTPDSIYRIGSISKVWTVLMAFKLREQGFVSFEDPIANLNSNFSIHNPWGITPDEASGKTLTIKHLASQVSGLPRETPCEEEECVGITTQEIFQRLSSQTLVHATDVQPSYSNLAYAILGNVMSEYVRDEPYNHTLFDTIIGPMGLKNTGLYLTPEQMEYATTGYEDQNTPVEYYDLGWVGPAGQLFSSVNDLSALLMQYFAAYPSLYQRGIDETYNFVVSPQDLREMLRPVFINPDQKSGFGSPWEIFMRNGHMVRSKGGNVDGFSSEIAIIPELKLGIVALINCGTSESLITTSALDILIPAFEEWTNEMKASKFKSPHDANYYNDLVGVYGIEGEAVARIYVDEVSGYPMLSSPLIFPTHGLLTPLTSNEAAFSDASSASTFAYNELYSNLNSCFATTLNGMDGLPLTFVQNQDGKFQAFRADGKFYGLEFTRMDDDTKLLGGEESQRRASHWLRGVLQQAPSSQMSFERDVIFSDQE